MALACRDYQPREAGRGVLHAVVREHLDAFLQEAADRGDGTGPPSFVEQEFRDFLILAIYFDLDTHLDMASHRRVVRMGTGGGDGGGVRRATDGT